MGLFDSLAFNPSAYGGQGGGLLDLLRGFQTQQQYQPGAGFGDQPTRMLSVGNYQMPQFGNPDPASLPPNAQPVQGQLPPGQAAPAQPEGPGLGERLLAGFQGFAAGGGLLPALAGAAQGLSSGMANQTERALVQRGVDPATARAAVLNPEIMKAILPRVFPTYSAHNVGDTATSFNAATGKFSPEYMAPKIEKIGSGETVVQIGGQPGQQRTAAPIPGIPTPQPKFDDVSGLRKEITALPEVKRYSEAAPIFASMTKNLNNQTAAADLDFVYGVAKIFDPESVVREGEMKLVGQAQSIPEAIKGMMQRVVYGGERLTPEARARILEVAQTRMKELEGATNLRLGPYSGIAQRNNMRVEDILPQLPTIAQIPPLASAAPAPQTQSLQGYRIRSVR